MAYFVTETGRELLGDAERFCELEIYNKKDISAEELRNSLCQMGYQTLTIPENLGGFGIVSKDVAAIYEEIAKADASLAVTVAGSNLALRAVLEAGTDAQKEKVCGILSEGGLGAFCLTESDAGSDATNIKTKAVLQTDGTYKITGTKQFITNGGIADFYVVAAKLGDAVELFLIEKGTAGLKAGEPEEKLGIRNCDTCAVDLSGCVVGADAKVEGGMKSILAALNEGRVYMAAMAIGVAQRALEEAIKYAKDRKQFDRPIADNQAIRFKLADMKTKIEAARQLTAYASEKMDSGEEFSKEAAMAKVFAAETAVEVTGKAMDIFGGYGYVNHYPAEQLLRDARVFGIIEGTGEMQRTLIADKLLKSERG